MHVDNLSDMVKEQIIARGIKDQKVIEAFYEVDRKIFVPTDLMHLAYEDRPLPIGYGQTISQPYIVSFMTEAAKLNDDCKVLEIGTGSGYQTAILSKICKEVYTIEIVRPLAEVVQLKFKELGLNNIHTRIGDGYEGWKEEAPFDVIIVTAAPKSVPENLMMQLKEGGRMVVPVGESNQELLRITYYKENPIVENLIPVRFVPMVHEAR